MGIYVNPGNEEFKIGASEHLRQPSPPFRKIHGGKYAGGILWKRG